MVFKLGTLEHAKGFVIHKLFEQECFGGRHIPVGFLSQGYPPNFRHLISAAVSDLQKEGVILVQPKRTGKGHGNHATLVAAKLDKARALLNGYRASVGLPRLGKDLKTLLPIKSTK